MKPDDANGRLPPEKRPFRVLLIAGSNRRQYDCPGIDSKARALMFRMADRLPQDWEIDLEDLVSKLSDLLFPQGLDLPEPGRGESPTCGEEVPALKV